MTGRRAALESGRIFVGRRDELATLRAQWDLAIGGETRLVLVEGEAGIGKSSLAHSLVRGIEGTRVVRGAGVEGEGLPMGLVGQLLRDLGEPGDGYASAGASGLGRGDDPLVVGDCLLRAISDAEEAGPLLLVVEDAHWADEGSLSALAFAVRRLGRARVLVLVTARPGGVDGHRSLSRLVDEPWLGCRLALGGLSTCEMCELSEALGAGMLPVPAARRLADHTGGNPLWACAVLEELGSSGVSTRLDGLPVPRSISMAVLARLSRLPPDARRLVVAAAVLRHDVPAGLLGRVAGVEGWQPALEDACRSGTLVAVGGLAGEPTVAFGHDLYRAVVLEDLSPENRSELHRRAASHLPGSAGLRHAVMAASGPDADLAARLEAAAGGEPDPVVAAHLLRSAAALSAEADERGRRILAAAARLLAGRCPREADALHDDVRALPPSARRDAVLGELALAGGDVAGAAQWLDPLVAAGNPDSTVLAVAGIVHLLLGRMDPAGEAMAAALDPGPTDGTHRLLDGPLAPYVATVLVAGGHRASAVAALDRAVAAGGSRHATVQAVRGCFRTLVGDHPGAVDDLRRALGAASPEGAPAELPHVHACLAESLFHTGRWQEAEAHAELAAALATEAGQGWLVAYPRAVSAQLAAARGELDVAAGHVRAAAAAAVRRPSWLSRSQVRVAEAVVAEARGDHRAALDALRPLDAEPVRTLLDRFGRRRWRALWVEAALAVGDLDGARRQAALVAPDGMASEVDVLAAARVRGLLASAEGRHDDAAEELGQVAGAPDQLMVAAPYEAAMAELVLADHLRHRGDRRGAVQVLRRARGRLVRVGAGPALESCDRQLRDCGLRPPPGPDRTPFELTAVEAVVARRAAAGATNAAVASELHMSARTVEQHLLRVLAKLGVASRVELIGRLDAVGVTPAPVDGAPDPADPPWP